MDQLSSATSVLYRATTSLFDFCRARCRTSSSSIDRKHYRNDTHLYCYGRTNSASPQVHVPEEDDDGDGHRPALALEPATSNTIEKRAAVDAIEKRAVETIELAAGKAVPGLVAVVLDAADAYQRDYRQSDADTHHQLVASSGGASLRGTSMTATVISLLTLLLCSLRRQLR